MGELQTKNGGLVAVIVFLFFFSFSETNLFPFSTLLVNFVLGCIGKCCFCIWDSKVGIFFFWRNFKLSKSFYLRIKVWFFGKDRIFCGDFESDFFIFWNTIFGLCHDKILAAFSEKFFFFFCSEYIPLFLFFLYLTIFQVQLL